MAFSKSDTMLFVGAVLETSFYGLYCVAFAVHARIRSTNKGGGTNIAIYPLSLLFLLCTAFCAIDTALSLFLLRFEGNPDAQIGLASYHMNITNTALYCAITFLAQGILIYRCWLMWGRKLLVIGIPFILVWLSFGTSLATLGSMVEPPSSRIPGAAKAWFYPLSTAAFSVSLAVNAIVATLLAIKIFMFQRQAQQSLTVQRRRIHPIRNLISIINDSGMVMLACQVVWLALFKLNNLGFFVIKGPFVMIYGLTPTLIFQRIPPSGQFSPNGSYKEKPNADRNAKIRFAS